jgi:photosystem II stability/assembly factor-like uncharacterized protein
MTINDNYLLKPQNALTILLVLVISASVLYIDNKQNIPIPTDIIERKKDRKIFKQHRKDWMENMHRSAPDVDWREIDQNTRNAKFINNTNNRKNLLSDEQAIRNILSVPGEWHERGSNNQAGRIRTSYIDHENEEIYCASSGGNIWRGSLDGSNWTSLNDYYQIKGIHYLNRFNYSNGVRMIMVNDKNCFRTDDDGYIIETASGLESVQEWGWFFRTVIADDDQGTIYLAAIEWDYDAWTYMPSIYKSIDSGVSFTRIVELTAQNGFIVGTSHFDIWVSDNPSDGPIILNDGDIYQLNGISNETTLIYNINPSGSGNNIIIGGQSENGQAYLHTRIGDDLYSSMDAGYSWVAMGELPTGTFTINSFECSNSDPNRLAIGNVDGYTTTNGGQTWQMVNHWWEYYSSPESKLHADIPEISYNVDPGSSEEFQLICTDGGIYRSYDHFENVENISLSGLGVSQYYSTYTGRQSPYHVFAGSQDQGFQRHLSEGTYDGVLDFEQTISGDYGHIVSADGGASLWTDYPGFVMYYPDIANSTDMASWDFQGSGYLWLPPIMNDPNLSNIVYIGGGGIDSQNHMVRVTYGINGMVAEDLGHTFESKISAMSYSPLSDSQWYVSTEDGAFFYSDDGGESFTQSTNFSGPESHYFYGSTILPSPIEDQRLYIGGSGYSNPAIYKSENGGETFSSFNANLPNTLVYDMACLPDESIIFAATEVGPYAYSSEEGVWESMSEAGAPEQVYWSVEYIDEIHTVRFGTYGRGIWDYTFDYDPIMILGDINTDGIINVDDLITLVAILLSNQTISEDTLGIGDLDHNDKLNIIDLLLLVEMIE